MHAIVIVVVLFFNAVPAHDGQPAVAEHAETRSAVVASQEACHALGEATMSVAAQTSGVAYGTFGCLEVTNQSDRQA